jgi:hypothetical protein
MPITTFCDLNPAHGEMYSIQHYVIKFASDLPQVSGFSVGTSVSSINKTDHHDITEKLLKVALNTINHIPRKKTLKLQILLMYCIVSLSTSVLVIFFNIKGSNSSLSFSFKISL